MIATNKAHDREALATFARIVAERCAREKYLDDFLLWRAGRSGDRHHARGEPERAIAGTESARLEQTGGVTRVTSWPYSPAWMTPCSTSSSGG